MKLGIISDIHANPVALEKVLADAVAQGCGDIICLGDIVGYGYDPQRCIDIVRKEGIECIRGNHDDGFVGKLSLEWFSPTATNGVLRQRGQVNEESKAWIRSLPYFVRREYGPWRCFFAHGDYKGRAGKPNPLGLG